MDVPLSLQTRPNRLVDPWFGLHHPTATATSGGSTTLLKRCPIMLREEVVSDVLFSFLLGDLIKWAIKKKETMTNQMSTRCRLPRAESPMNFHFQCHKESLNQEQCEGLYLRVNDPSYATAFRTTASRGTQYPTEEMPNYSKVGSSFSCIVFFSTWRLDKMGNSKERNKDQMKQGYSMLCVLLFVAVQLLLCTKAMMLLIVQNRLNIKMWKKR